MSNNYQGFLLKFDDREFDNKYIAEYSSTPDQRLDVEAERDNTGYLHRSTLPNGKTSIEFTTHIMNLDQKIECQGIIQNGITFENERKGYVTYWNDETNDYDTMECYIPDVKYTILDADENTIRYAPVTIELIEY